MFESCPVRRLRVPVALAAALVLGFAGIPRATAQTQPERTMAGRIAPGFSVQDLSGRPIKLSAYRGRVVLLNFWATWCAPCLVEIPTFAGWQKQYGSKGLQVLGVSMDDEPRGVRRTVAKLNPGYPMMMGDERLGTKYGGILGLPVTFLIDRQGRIRHRYEGAADLKQMRADLDALIAAR